MLTNVQLSPELAQRWLLATQPDASSTRAAGRWSAWVGSPRLATPRRAAPLAKRSARHVPSGRHGRLATCMRNALNLRRNPFLNGRSLPNNVLIDSRLPNDVERKRDVEMTSRVVIWMSSGLFCFAWIQDRVDSKG